MSSNHIYHTCNDRSPYTYYIKWTKFNKSYYGRRTAKGCHPSDFWISYKTSSDYVKDFIKEFGDPDVIQIRRIFNSIIDCNRWEEKVLRRLNAAKSEIWLNKSNGKDSFDTTGRVSVIDSNGYKRIIAVNDFYNNPTEYNHPTKQKTTVKDKFGNTMMVSIDDPRLLSGEFVGITSGQVVARDSKTGKTIGLVDKDDIRFKTGELLQLNSGFTTRYNLLTGEQNRFTTVEAKRLSPYWLGVVTKKAQALDKNNTKITVSIYDERWKFGELRRCDSNGKALW